MNPSIYFPNGPYNAILPENNLFHICLSFFLMIAMFIDDLVQVMVEAYRRDAGSKEQLIGELRSTKKRLVAEVSELKQALLDAQGETQAAVAEQGRLRLDLQRVEEQMNGLEAHLQAVQTERDTLDQQIQVHTWYRTYSHTLVHRRRETSRSRYTHGTVRTVQY